MTDIVERLRYWHRQEHPKELLCLGDLLMNAADEIERLQYNYASALVEIAEVTQEAAKLTDKIERAADPMVQHIASLEVENAKLRGELYDWRDRTEPPEYEYMPYRINSDPAKGWVPFCLIVIGGLLLLSLLPLIILGGGGGK